MNAVMRSNALEVEPSARPLLLIESDADQAAYWELLLASLGFAVTCADSLASARGHLSQHPALVVCAAHVADGRGSELFTELRGDESYRRAYLVLLTSEFGNEELIESLSFGANDCIDKGATYSELRARFKLAERMISLTAALHEKSTELGDALGKLQMELESAARLQAAMLPAPYEAGGVRIEVFYQASDILGGDMLGIAPLQADRQIAFGLVDVVGHGTASALISCSLVRDLMDRMATLFAGGQDTQSCGQRALEEMNLRYCRLGIPGMYFTAIAGILDRDAGRISYCQAGHPSLYACDASGHWRLREDSGFPVGLLEQAAFSSSHIPLQQGGSVLLVSDGLLRPSEADPIGSHALLEELQQAGTQPARVVSRLAALAAQVPVHERDDQSAMLISLS